MDVCVICTDSLNTIDTINHKLHFVCFNKYIYFW